VSPPPETILGELLAGRSLAVAESCTGGALAARVVAVAGSSRYFVGGVVTYSDDAKRRLLGVPTELLATEGAVSEGTARWMARSVRALLGADVAVSTTGIAGPGGGTPTKPVGLVYVALSSAAGELCTRNVWAGDRSVNIELSVGEALRLLCEHLKGGT
jgi:PncC family amidohydrolase